MAEFVEIHWASGSIDEARKISRYLVQERLVASAKIVPWVEAIYEWNNQLETTQESHVIFRTRAQNVEKVEEIIKQNSKYEIPEITVIQIAGGNTDYLKWIEESTPNQFSTQNMEKI